MNQLLSFHNKPRIKQLYLKRVLAHKKADEIIKGKYWKDGKGCAVGCTIEGSDHKLYETELGLPEWLARLEDHLFENLENGQAKEFPLKFLEAINIGSDLSLVKPKFFLYCLENLPKDYEKFSDCKKAVENVIELLKQESEGKIISKEDWDKNESAAWSAESAAWSAAWSAAASAAWSAAWSSAASAAWSAESAAESAAWSAAWSAESAAKSAWSAAKSAAESAAWSAESAAASAAWSAAASAAWSAAASAAESAAWSSAASAAWSAAESAAKSAWSAAKSATYSKMANKLLDLLKEAK